MRLSVVIVCFGGDVRPVLDALAAQRRDGDEVIVVDNLAGAGGTATVRDHRVVDVLLEPPSNLHYADGCNLGAARAHGDAILLLNPDTVPEMGFLDAMRRPPADWAAWSGVLTLPGGVRINNAGGPVHFLGLAWAGRFEEPVTALPPAPYPAGFLTGGCLAIRRAAWERLGGYAPGYGAYHEDTELSLRLRLAGEAFGFLPAARAEHDYAFDKGAAKWRFLETNRWRTVVRTYPTRLLLSVMPLLLAAEPFLLVAAAAGGWLPSKLRAYRDLVAWAPSAPAERRAVQRHAAVTGRSFADGLTWELDSPFLGRAGTLPPVRIALRASWRAILALQPRR